MTDDLVPMSDWQRTRGMVWRGRWKMRLKKKRRMNSNYLHWGLGWTINYHWHVTGQSAGADCSNNMCLHICQKTKKKMKGRTESAGEVSPELADDKLHQSSSECKLVSRTKGRVLLTASSSPDIPLVPHLPCWPSTHSLKSWAPQDLSANWFYSQSEAWASAHRVTSCHLLLYSFS